MTVADWKAFRERCPAGFLTPTSPIVEKERETLMGYDLHITRAEFWAENEGSQIAPEEWLALVEGDPELTLVADESNPYLAGWSGQSVHAEPWFDWFNGNVYSKNPDQPVILKMVDIARHLKGKVQGEEGEEYDGSEEGFTL